MHCAYPAEAGAALEQPLAIVPHSAVAGTVECQIVLHHDDVRFANIQLRFER